MKVWCLFYDNGQYEAATLVGIFATRELAEQSDDRTAAPDLTMIEEWEVEDGQPSV